MKKLAVLIALIAGLAPVRAQNDADRRGPVVYPASATNAPDAASVPGASQMAPDAPLPAPPAALSAPAASANGQAEDIDDIRPPFFYIRSWFWLWIALAVLALIGLAVWLWIWFKPQRVLHAKTAYELALEKLEKARALIDEKNPEPYAVFVSETVRGYLGQRFHAPSTRRTTEEFLRQMQSDTATPLAEHRDLLRNFLEACDLVKFAHYQPDLSELEQVQQRAVTFVTATKPVELNGSRP